MDQIKGLCQLLYPSKCCQKILVEHTIEAECFKVILAKTLGYGIIFSSTLVKLPQLMKLMSLKSAIGVSFLSVILELIALTLSSSYSYANGFPFSAWGEALFLMFMTSLVAFLIIYYDINKGQSYIFMIIYAIAVAVLMSGQVPMEILRIGQMLTLPLILSSKLVQALINFRNGHTGNLSAITISMIFAGSTVRIFTSIQETGDFLIILGFILSTSINFILTLQIFLYWDKTNDFLKLNAAKKDK